MTAKKKRVVKRTKPFTDAEMRFLKRISDSEPDPWGIMAFDAIVWGGRDTLENLKAKFKK